VTEQEVIEHIDIGGPTLIRAAAKNHAFVGRGRSPGELRRRGRGAGRERRACSARRASRSRRRRSAPPPGTTPRSRAGSRSARKTFPNHFVAAFEKVLDLSYGENPHQRAAYYEQVGMRTHLLARTVKMHGKELSLQQPARPRLGSPPATRVRGAGLRDHQAQQSVRERRRRDGHGGLRESAGVRSPERVRRRRRVQQGGRPGSSRRS
jgi:hypothetical protein